MKNHAAFDLIPFKDLVRHCLLDQFEYSAHTFDKLDGPYYWSGMGALESPVPEAKILKDAKNHRAKHIYLAHTHVLSSDDALRFLNAKVDPREEIAFGKRPLPMGNPPSFGDIKYLKHLKKKFLKSGISVEGVIFAASGIWEFNVDLSLSLTKFRKAYDDFNPLTDDPDFYKNMSATLDFPNFFMELETPKMYTKKYKTKLTKSQHGPIRTSSIAVEVSRQLKFYKSNGVKTKFHPYIDFGVDPLHILRNGIIIWSDKLFIPRPH